MKAESGVAKPKDRSRTVYAWWAGGLGALLILGLFCWGVLLPVRQVWTAERNLASRFNSQTVACSGEDMRAWFREEVGRLGGPDAAAHKIGTYLRMPARLAIGNHGVSLDRDFAILALGECGERGADVLLRIIGEESAKPPRSPYPTYHGSYWLYDARLGAVPALGHTGSHRGVPALVGLLGDSLHGDHAAEALGEIGDPGCVDAVIAELRKGHRSAVWALQLLKDPRGIGPLLPLLADRDKTLREWTAEVLAEKGPEAAEPLLGGLADRALRVRLQAAKALGRIGDPRAVEPLLAMLRRRADEPMLLGEEDVTRVTTRMPDGMTFDTTNLHLAAQERAAAADALGRIGDRRAIEPLSAAIRDPAAEVRLPAIVALWSARSPGDPQALRAALREVCGRAAAERPLSLDSSRLLDSLDTLALDDRPEVRDAAAAAGARQ